MRTLVLLTALFLLSSANHASAGTLAEHKERLVEQLVFTESVKLKLVNLKDEIGGAEHTEEQEEQLRDIGIGIGKASHRYNIDSQKYIWQLKRAISEAEEAVIPAQLLVDSLQGKSENYNSSLVVIEDRLNGLRNELSSFNKTYEELMTEWYGAKAKEQIVEATSLAAHIH